jgi:hypothetical protein
MIVLVSGGRTFDDYATVQRVLDEVIGWAPTGHLTIVNGGAIGADQLSTRWAQERGETWVEVPVAKNPAGRVASGAKFDWETDGRVAGFLRNQYMLDTHHPEQAVVFPGGNGTQDMLERLFRAGVNTWVVGR